MGELNLDAIRRNAELVLATRHRWASEVGVRDPDVLDGLRCAKQLAVEDVPALLAEVKRLRGELDAIGDLAYRFSYHESPSAVDDLLIAIVGRAKRAARGGESRG